MNKEKGKIYAAYGSNLNLEQMAHRCPAAKVLGVAELDGYRLLFRGDSHSAVATVEKYEGGSVPLLLWEIAPAAEAALDRYEGWPHLYRKETIEVKYGGERISAMIYIMNGGWPLGAPSLYYYRVIWQGYEDAGFDLAILGKAAHFSATRARKAKV